ncbi:MAG: VanZ family protein [Planctomycetaceae bacterium]
MSDSQPTKFTSIPRGYVAAAGVVAAIGLLLIAPIDYPGRLLGVVFDYGHVPAFALLVFAVTRLLCGKSPSIKTAGTIAIAATVFGVGAEFVQQYVGRSAEPGDAFANAIGAAIGFLAATWNQWRPNQRRLGTALLIIGTIAAVWSPTWTLIDINRQRNEFPLLGSFESELELSRWHSRRSSRRRSDKHASDGKFCLEWKLRPARYPEVHTRWPFGDWSLYQDLEVDIWNDHSPLPIVVKIEDASHNGQYEDRFQQEILLPTGKTTVRVNLNDVRTAPQSRELNMQQIARVAFFTADLTERRVLYLDRLELTGANASGE